MSTDLQTAPSASSVPAYLEPARQHYLRLASEKRFMEEAGYAVGIFAANSYLAGATPESKLRAVMNVATSGLTLNPMRREAYLVPRQRDGKRECNLEPSYIGLVKLLTDGGAVKLIECHWIYEGDEAVVDMASDRKVLKHVPYSVRGQQKGKRIACYSIATLPDGTRHIEVMADAEIQDIMKRSEAYKAKAAGKTKSAGPWDTDYDEMGRKTVVKRQWKYLPKAGRLAEIAEAIALDNEDYKDATPSTAAPVTDVQAEMLELRKQAKTALAKYQGDDKAEIVEMCREEAESGAVDPDFWRGVLNRINGNAA